MLRTATAILTSYVFFCGAVANELELPTRNSDAFNFSYEADTLPEQASPAWMVNSGGEKNTAEVADGILHLRSLEEDDAANYYFWSLPDASWAHFNRTSGFSCEMKARAEKGKAIGINLAAVEEGGSGYGVLKITDEEVVWVTGSGSETVVLSSENNADDFHIFRVVKLPETDGNPGLYRIYRDGKMIGDQLPGKFATEPIVGNRFYFGDIGTWDSGGAIDYLRWDSTGAYAPESQ